MNGFFFYKKSTSKEARVGMSFPHVDDIFLSISIDDKQGFYRSPYMEAFALSYSEKMSTIVLSDNFPIGGAVVVFFGLKL